MRHRQRAVPGRGEPRLSGARRSLESRATSSCTLDAGSRATLVASTESFEIDAACSTPEHALDAERGRRQRLLAQAQPAAREGVAAELVLAADQFIITPAGRTEEAARAHAYGDEVRTVIAGYHWFTDWGRDTMISLEGLTLVTGRQRRSRLHPAHVRALRARRPDPEHVSRRREGRAVSHRGRHAVVLPRDRSATSSARDDRLTLSLLYPTLKDIIDCAHARHAVRHPRRSARRPARAGRDGLSAHVDGREGGRLGRDAAARQGGRDQRALVQRAAADGAVGGRAADDHARAEYRARADRGAALVQRALLVSTQAAISTTSSTPTPRGGGDDAEVPAESAASRSRCRTPCSRASAGSR